MNAAHVVVHTGAGNARLTHASRLLTFFAFAAGIALPISLRAQSLPDTGQDRCYDGSSMGACSSANTGDTSTYPRQDGRYGRDQAVVLGGLSKIGGGQKGFDYTKLDASGNALSIQNGGWATSSGYDSGSEAAGTKWSCIQDNITGLIWEVKTHDATPALRDWTNTYTWYNANASMNSGNAGSTGTDTCNATLTPVYGAYCNTHNYISAVNAANLCGHNDWRLPNTRELLTLAHRGADYLAIDSEYFPNTQYGAYWAFSSYSLAPLAAWSVKFDDGSTQVRPKSDAIYLRLVRGAAF